MSWTPVALGARSLPVGPAGATAGGSGAVRLERRASCWCTLGSVVPAPAPTAVGATAWVVAAGVRPLGGITDLPLRTRRSARPALEANCRAGVLTGADNSRRVVQLGTQAIEQAVRFGLGGLGVARFATGGELVAATP